MKSMSQNSELHSKVIASPLGPIAVTCSEKGLQKIYFNGRHKSFTRLKENDSLKSHPWLAQAEQELQEYFAGERHSFDVPLDPQGTDFQRKVWKELSRIPYGRVVSYKKQAESMKTPKAVRAIAAANGKNPLSIIIPCHRVIASNGHLHGYAGGLSIKSRLLEIEGLNIKAHQWIND